MQNNGVKRVLCLVLSVVMLVGLLTGYAYAESSQYDVSALAESARQGSWGAQSSISNGILSIQFSGQYAEQRYELPKEINPAQVQKIHVVITSGDVQKFCIKLLKGTEQADAVYGADTIEVSKDFDGIGFMSLSENGGAYEISGIEFTMAEAAEPTENLSLKDLYADEFIMGVACEAISHWRNRLSEIGNPDKEALISSQFNSITFGNELKPAYNMAYKSPDATETNLPFGANRAAIEMLNWAKENGIPVRGHTLIWHSQCEDAVFCQNYKPVYRTNGTLDPQCLVDAETMKLRMESYIHHVIEYMYANGYGDVIYAWDVVNEAIEPGSNPYNMRRSYWFNIIGAEFLMDAFQYTREAVLQYSAEYAHLYGIDPTDPEALKTIQPKLFYNDYSEFQPNKRDAIIRAVKPIAEAGYLDGIGMQGHLSDTTDINAYITALNMYSDVVSEVHITELDVAQSSSGVNADYYQAVFYNKLFAALLDAKHNGANLTAVTIWGLTDDNSWKKESSPLIFNGDLTPKLAYTGIVLAKTGETMPEPEYEAPDFSDAYYTFEDKNQNASALGFTNRGGCEVTVQRDAAHFGKGSLLCSGRTEKWHGASFDVSRFSGQTIKVTAYVKSDAPLVKLSADIDGVWPNLASVTPSKGTWAKLEAVYSVPSELTSLKLYFETTDLSDFYVDDICIKLVGQDEGFEGAQHTASPRGVGHMPVLSVSAKEHHSGSKSLQVTRQAQEATVSFNISKYVGRTVDVTAYVKTQDDTITIGLDDGTQKSAIPAVKGEWTEVKATFAIPANQTSALCFLETSGNADFYVDDFSVRIAPVFYDLEDGVFPFSTRWGGAGTLELIEEDGNHVARLTDNAESYYGICYDVTPFLGMEVQISFDVKTDDNSVRVSGDIDGVWPCYMTAGTKRGTYKSVKGIVRLPNDVSALRIYIESTGKSDLYVDNFSIVRVGLD